jgi:PAS domain S-box-containing protein
MLLSRHPYLIFLLVQNAALLALGVLGYCQAQGWLLSRVRPRVERLLFGVAIGVLGAFSMLGAVDVGDGVRLDLRNALVTVATAFGGLEGGAAAFAVIALRRVAMGGGIAATAGLASLGLAFVVSALYFLLVHARGGSMTRRHLAAAGILVGLSGLIVFVLLPPTGGSLALLDVAPVWGVMMPLTVVFLGSIILHFQRTRQRDEALREKDEDLTAILDNAPFAIFLKDRSSRVRLVNRHFEAWFGAQPSPDLRADPTVGNAQVAESDREVLDGGRTVQREVRSADMPMIGDQSVEWLLVTKYPIFDAEGAVRGIAGFHIDISERKKAEQTLRQREELLVEAQRLGKIGYVLVDLIARRVYWSDAVFALRGVEMRDFFSFHESMTLVHPDDRATYLEMRERAIATRQNTEMDGRVVQQDGTVHWVHTVIHPHFDEGGTPTSVMLVIRDTTDERRAAEALRRSEERLRALLEHSNDVIAVVSPTGALAYRSPSMTDLLGYPGTDDLVGRHLFELVHPDDVAGLTQSLVDIRQVAGTRANGQCRLRHKLGFWRHVAWSARNAIDIAGIDGIIVNLHDITETLRLEEQLMQAQKMEAIGQLAGGIAHDFNNILGAILGFGNFLLQDLPAHSEQHRFAERIVRASERGRDLVQQILAFSRQGGIDRRPCDLAQLVLDTKDLLRVSLPSSTQLDIASDGARLMANVNPAQIGQIVLNLCLNGNDALLGEPGSLTVRVVRVEAGDGSLAMFGDKGPALGAATVTGEGSVIAGKLDPGQAHARISVADTGTGMDGDLLKRIFEPFFTTKERSHGTGLGLSMVHGIVMGYSGAYRVTSRLGAGSLFDIYLPLASTASAPAPVDRSLPVLRGGERVLVIDDEMDLTDILVTGLDRLGYEVVAVNDPMEALETVASDPDAWDVVISDEVMPKLKGMALLRSLKELRAELRFILCSGYSDGASEDLALAAGANAFFVKPVSPEQLAACIRRLMEPEAAPMPAPAS